MRNFTKSVWASIPSKTMARRVANKAVGLSEDGTKYNIPEKVDALSNRIWNDKSAGGHGVKEAS